MQAVQGLRDFAAGCLALLAVGLAANGLAEVFGVARTVVCTTPGASVVHTLETLPFAWQDIRAPQGLLSIAGAIGLAGLATLCWPGRGVTASLTQSVPEAPSTLER